MLEFAAKSFVYLLAAYAGLGLLFAVPFVAWGIQRVDPDAHGSPLAFRLLLLPGVAAFWPMFLRRWSRGTTEPPVEKNGHR